MSNADAIALLQKRHAAIVRAVMDASQPALASAAADIVDEMKRQAPMLHAATDERQPGELRDSIVATSAGEQTPEIKGGGSRIVPPGSVFITAGNDQVPYAAYVEFGTSKMRAEPFFYPTIRLWVAATRQKIHSAFHEAINDAWKQNRE